MFLYHCKYFAAALCYGAVVVVVCRQNSARVITQFWKQWLFPLYKGWYWVGYVSSLWASGEP